MLFRDAGPLQEAEPCSQMEQVARFADTETPEPLLVPRGTARCHRDCRPARPTVRIAVVVWHYAVACPPRWPGSADVARGGNGIDDGALPPQFCDVGRILP